jgi:hypothetical protein
VAQISYNIAVKYLSDWHSNNMTRPSPPNILSVTKTLAAVSEAATSIGGRIILVMALREQSKII